MHMTPKPSDIVNQWQIEGIKKAIASADRGEGIPHQEVKKWVESWGSGKELPTPRPKKVTSL